MMKVLIGIKSCQRDQKDGVHQVIRETWGESLPEAVDLRFFVGGLKAPKLQNDEAYNPIDDGYWELLYKTRAIMRYALEHGYDYAYLADTDSYLNVREMMNCGFENFDYCGGVINPTREKFGRLIRPWRTFPHDCLISPAYAALSGGHGCFISRLAMKIALVFPWPCGEGEDFMIGTALGPFIVSGEVKAAILPELRKYAFHLGCGYYGGGHIERADIKKALRKRHEEVLSGLTFEPEPQEEYAPRFEPGAAVIEEKRPPTANRINVPNSVTQAALEYQKKRRGDTK